LPQNEQRVMRADFAMALTVYWGAGESRAEFA